MPDICGDIGVHNFWKQGQAGVFDVRVTDTDAPSQRDADPHTVLERHERSKKRKYLEPCLARGRSFTPLVFSADGLFGKEATAAIRRLACALALKWQRQYSDVVGYARARLSLALVRANSRCLRAERCPLWRSQQPAWSGGDGLVYFQ